jgi:hypothetical protein
VRLPLFSYCGDIVYIFPPRFYDIFSHPPPRDFVRHQSHPCPNLSSHPPALVASVLQTVNIPHPLFSPLNRADLR